MLTFDSDPRGEVLGTGYWVLGTGYWVLGTGYWVLGTGYSICEMGIYVKILLLLFALPNT
ncbi:hypothetical protein [Photobacterium alginatilyticum]|uniref:Uncharacterized protein n=1 Tax=Photobacterium alginatilyticum TaxID=1775171 RepID=A0ABW9YI93_9GAMM|nr:hypothetical protein [Photobacterium alginatilyticum]